MIKISDLNDLNFTNDSDIYLEQGNYYIYSTIIIPSCCSLTLNPKAKLIIMNNTVGIYLKWGAILNGGCISTNLNDFSSAFIYIEGSTEYSVYHTKIKQTRIINENFGGTGILAEDITSQGICYMILSDLYLANLEFGIKFISPKAPQGWANANTLENFSFYNCAYSIYANLLGEFSGNYIKNINIQTYSHTFKSALTIDCAGEFNTIEFMSWDKNDFVNTFYLHEKTRYNKILAPLLPNVTSYIDNGSNNFIDTYANPPITDNQTKIILDLTNLDSNLQYPLILNNYYNCSIIKNYGGAFHAPFSLKLEGIPSGWGAYASFYKVFIESSYGLEVCSKIISDESATHIAVFLRGGVTYTFLDFTNGANGKATLLTEGTFKDNNLSVCPSPLNGNISQGFYSGLGDINIDSNSITTSSNVL